MKVKCLSRLEFKKTLAKDQITDANVEQYKYGFILIENKETENHFLLKQTHPNVLQLVFDDYTKEEFDRFSLHRKEWVKLFDESQAKQIIEFVKENEDAQGFIIHCTAGICRSGAIGQFIATYFQLDQEEFLKENWYIEPNTYVLATLNDVLAYISVS